MIVDPLGVEYAATSAGGYFWSGFGVGLSLLAFALIKRMARGSVRAEF